MPIVIRKFRVGSADIEDNAIGSSAMIAADVIMGYHIVDDAIGSEHLEDNAVSYADQIKNGIIGSTELGADSVYSAKIANDAIGSEHIANNAISYGAQIKDGIIGYGELTGGLQGTMAAGSVPPANSIGTTQLKDPSVDTAELYDDAVGTSSKIAADVVMGYHIVDDAIGSEHLEANAVGSSVQVADKVIHDEHIVGSAITANKMAADAIGSSKIVANNVIGGDQVINNSLGYGELTSGLQGTIAAGSVPPADSIGTTQLKNDSVGSEHIRDGAIAYGTQIKADVIGSEHIENDAIGSSAMIAADVVMGYHIVDDAIGSEHLEADAVGSSAQIADDVIHDEHLANDAVGSSIHVANNTIGHDQLIDAAVGYTELTTGLQGSLIGAREQPYAGDDSEVTVTGATPGTIKTASVLKNAYCAPIGSIKIAAQLKASAGTYTMQVLLGTVHKFSFAGTETTYKLHTGSMGVGGESDGVLALEFTIKNSQAAGISYNKLVDIITVM